MLIRKILRFGLLEPLQKTKQETRGETTGEGPFRQQRGFAVCKESLRPALPRQRPVRLAVAPLWASPIFCSSFSPSLMNIKTLKILPLGSGRSRCGACPRHGVSDPSKPSPTHREGRGEGSSAGHAPHPIPGPPGSGCPAPRGPSQGGPSKEAGRGSP